MEAAASMDMPVDALFNCAGVGPGPAPLNVMKINFIGTRLFTQRILHRMDEGAAIVSVASNGGLDWRKNLPYLLEFLGCDTFEAAAAWYERHYADFPAAYSFSKEALIVWTMAQAPHLAPRGIRINCVCPGAVQTPMLEAIEAVTPRAVIDAMAQPAGRRSSPEEQAWPLAFLNSEVASYVNGAVLQVDGGFLAARTTNAADAPQPIGRR